jgi:hypothetical protein
MSRLYWINKCIGTHSVKSQYGKNNNSMMTTGKEKKGKEKRRKRERLPAPCDLPLK